MFFSQLLMALLMASTALGSPPARRDNGPLLRTGSIEPHDSAAKQRTLTRRAEAGPSGGGEGFRPEAVRAIQEAQDLGQEVWLCVIKMAREARFPLPPPVTTQHTLWEMQCLKQFGAEYPGLPEGDLGTREKVLAYGKHIGYRYGEKFALCVTKRVSEWRRTSGEAGDRNRDVDARTRVQWEAECLDIAMDEAAAETAEELQRRATRNPPSTEDDNNNNEYTMQSPEKTPSRNPSAFLSRISHIINSVHGDGSRGAKGAPLRRFGTPAGTPRIPFGAY